MLDFSKIMANKMARTSGLNSLAAKVQSAAPKTATKASSQKTGEDSLQSVSFQEEEKVKTPSSNADAVKRKKNDKGQYEPDLSDKTPVKTKEYEDNDHNRCVETVYDDGTIEVKKYEPRTDRLFNISINTNDRGVPQEDLEIGDKGKFVSFTYGEDGSYYIFTDTTDYKFDPDQNGVLDPSLNMVYKHDSYELYDKDGKKVEYDLGPAGSLPENVKEIYRSILIRRL